MDFSDILSVNLSFLAPFPCFEVLFTGIKIYLIPHTHLILSQVLVLAHAAYGFLFSKML